jgi:vacuolar-type H+-ATPase catalytic subunit A/Vma1
MRVTKLIREYVEKKVNESYPKSVAELVYEEHGRKINDAITEANEKVYEYAKALAEELNAKYGFPADSNLTACDHYNTVSNRYNYDSEIYRAYRKAKDERQQKIEEKIEEILLTLELGGSKADLDKMLANIGK